MKKYPLILLYLCSFQSFISAQSLQYKYDKANRLKEIDYPNQKIAYYYDNDGNRTSIVTDNSLPVQLFSFIASKQKNQVLLSWEVAQEIDLAKYDVQFSTDAQTFQTFATVVSKGSSAKVEYNTLHCCPITGNNYYRLKMIDKDGKFTYSQIQKVVYEDVNSFKIYPNPVANKANITVSFEKPLSSISMVYIYNVLGSKVLATSFAKGQSIYNLKLPALATGTYFITINTKEKLYQGKFIK